MNELRPSTPPVFAATEEKGAPASFTTLPSGSQHTRPTARRTYQPLTETDFLKKLQEANCTTLDQVDQIYHSIHDRLRCGQTYKKHMAELSEPREKTFNDDASCIVYCKRTDKSVGLNICNIALSYLGLKEEWTDALEKENRRLALLDRSFGHIFVQKASKYVKGLQGVVASSLKNRENDASFDLHKMHHQAKKQVNKEFSKGHFGVSDEKLAAMITKANIPIYLGVNEEESLTEEALVEVLKSEQRPQALKSFCDNPLSQPLIQQLEAKRFQALVISQEDAFAQSLITKSSMQDDEDEFLLGVAEEEEQMRTEIADKILDDEIGKLVDELNRMHPAPSDPSGLENKKE